MGTADAIARAIDLIELTGRDDADTMACLDTLAELLKQMESPQWKEMIVSIAARAPAKRTVAEKACLRLEMSNSRL
jgi:hypothetical protein